MKTVRSFLVLFVGIIAGAGATLLLLKPFLGRSVVKEAVAKVAQDQLDASFMLPAEMEAKAMEHWTARSADLGLRPLSEVHSLADDPYTDITGDDIHGYLRDLTEFSMQSKADGNVLWGRIQGSKYERAATEYVRDKFVEWGLEEVRLQEFPVYLPLWRPSKIELTAVDGSASSVPQGGYTFTSAMTAFEAGTTPPEGITAPIEYVGLGTRADLMGRDLTGKIALVYARAFEGVLFHSGAVAAMRIARTTDAVGVIMWFDLPGNATYAGWLFDLEGGLTSLPWLNVGYYDGLYLRKLIEHAEPGNPPEVHMTVNGTMSDGFTSQNLIAEIPGTSDEYLIVTAHIDGFFSAALDNGTGVAGLMALAKYYASLPKNERHYNLLFLVTGDHEESGYGGSVKFAEAYPEIIAKTAAVVQLEHMASPERSADMNIGSFINTETPRKLFISRLSPAMTKLFVDAGERYGIVMETAVMQEYAGDVDGWSDLGLHCGGWIEASHYYHSDADSPDLINATALEDMTRAYAEVLDGLDQLSAEEIAAGSKEPLESIYESDALMYFLSMW